MSPLELSVRAAYVVCACTHVGSVHPGGIGSSLPAVGMLRLMVSMRTCARREKSQSEFGHDLRYPNESTPRLMGLY